MKVISLIFASSCLDMNRMPPDPSTRRLRSLPQPSRCEESTQSASHSEPLPAHPHRGAPRCAPHTSPPRLIWRSAAEGPSKNRRASRGPRRVPGANIESNTNHLRHRTQLPLNIASGEGAVQLGRHFCAALRLHSHVLCPSIGIRFSYLNDDLIFVMENRNPQMFQRHSAVGESCKVMLA